MQVAYQNSDVQAAGWMRSGTGQLCVNRTDAFTYDRPSGDPSANCGGVLIPVAHDFVPDEPGKFTYTIEWYGYAIYVAIGKSGQPKKQRGQHGFRRFRRQLAQLAVPPGTRAGRERCAEKIRRQRSVRSRCECVECEGPRRSAGLGARGRARLHRSIQEWLRRLQDRRRAAVAGLPHVEFQREARARPRLLGDSGRRHHHVFLRNTRD